MDRAVDLQLLDLPLDADEPGFEDFAPPAPPAAAPSFDLDFLKQLALPGGAGAAAAPSSPPSPHMIEADFNLLDDLAFELDDDDDDAFFPDADEPDGQVDFCICSPPNPPKPPWPSTCSCTAFPVAFALFSAATSSFCFWRSFFAFQSASSWQLSTTFHLGIKKDRNRISPRHLALGSIVWIEKNVVFI